ncbi:MAG: lipid asymmetry maintenance protein MlaB [Ectothiorhodospira sp.]
MTQAGPEEESVRLEEDPDGLRLVGPLTRGTVPDLWSLAPGRLHTGGTPCRVDLSGVTRADSAGVALLVAWMGRRGGREGLVFSGVPEQMRPLIRLSDLEGVLPEEGAQTD